MQAAVWPRMRSPPCPRPGGDGRRVLAALSAGSQRAPGAPLCPAYAFLSVALSFAPMLGGLPRAALPSTIPRIRPTLLAEAEESRIRVLGRPFLLLPPPFLPFRPSSR